MLKAVQAPPIPSTQSLTYTATGTLYANFAYTPLIPYVNDTVTFDASSSIGSIVSIEWDFGDGTNGTGIITSKVYTEATNYTVILTVTDNEGVNDSASRVVTVIPRPEGPAIDLYNQMGGYGPNEPSEDFAPGEIVELTAMLTYYEEPVEYKLVGFEVRNAIGEVILDRSNMTDINGLAKINFTIRGGCLPEIFGTWTALAVASVWEQTVSDTLTFEVTGPLIDVYTQKEPYDGKGPNQSSDAFAPQEEVILYADVHYNCQPVEYKPVGFEVVDPTGETVLARTNMTDGEGIATTTFRLSSNATFGIYTVFATVEVLEENAIDTLSFRVGWIIEITKIETVDQYGSPKINFSRSEEVYFSIDVKNIAFTAKDVTLTVSILDEVGQTIGVSALFTQVFPGAQEFNVVCNLKISEWCFVGSATAPACALTNWPWNDGTPYCPEKSASFLILAG